jgi:PAS domain S-box-containing protein
MLQTVSVPAQFESLFQKAQEYVSKYFSLKTEDPTQGTIEIFGQRYILVRAASMSVDFFDTIRNLYKGIGDKEAINIARSILFDIAHTIGKMDARNFHKKMHLEDPIEKLSAGPIHFSHSGWAYVDIFPESKPSPDENYFLLYDHPFSFESDAWIQAGKQTEFPVCVMNAGYSSGWCEESFGVTLVASELTCKAKGDEACRFVMAHPSRIESYIQDYLEQAPEIASKVISYQIPGLFERKWMEEKLRESEANYLTIFNEVNDAILLHDLNTGSILDVNNGFCEMFGYTRDESLTLNIGAISSGEAPYTQQDAGKLIQKASSQGPQVFEWQAKHKNGRLFWIEVNLKRAKIMGQDRILAVVRDITDRKEAANALLQAKVETDHINVQLKEAIENANMLACQANTANETKSQFLANMSHEIRTPMNAILGFSDLLQSENLTETQKDYVDMVTESAEGLLLLINDILDFSKIEAGKLDIEITSCSLREVLSVVESLMKPMAAKQEIEFTVFYSPELPDEIQTDPMRLRQCLINLVSNAIKFTEQGHVKVTVCLEKERYEEYISFQVEDTGTGIPADKQGKIFDTFYQTDGSSTRKFGGTGLGLSITKQLSEMLDGALTVQSQEGQGTIFSLWIPRGGKGKKQTTVKKA